MNRSNSLLGLLRVIRVTLAVGQPLPVYPDKEIFSESVGMSQWCQLRKSMLLTGRRWGRKDRPPRYGNDTG